MARTEQDSSLGISDDDSVSLTSTVGSDEQAEYAVEGIIAERKVGGKMQYLVRWEGYPDERCTWEPRSSFQNDETFRDWKTKKARFEEGLEKPCDIEALLDRVEKWITSTEERKSRRRAKRARLGLFTSSIDESATEAEDEEGYDSLFEEQENPQPNEAPSSRQNSDSTLLSTSKNSPNDSPVKDSHALAPIADMRRSWTDDEENTLMEALERVGGPDSDQIFELYGSRGTIKQSFPERSLADILMKIQELPQKLKDSNKEIPHFLVPRKSSRGLAVKPIPTREKAPMAVMFSVPQVQASNQSKSKLTSETTTTTTKTTTTTTTSSIKSPSDIAIEDPSVKGSISAQKNLGVTKEPKLVEGPSRRASLPEKFSDQTLQDKPFPPSVSSLSRTTKEASPTDLDITRSEAKSSSSTNPMNKRRGSLPDSNKKPRLELLPVPPAQNTARKVSEAQGTQLGSSGRGPARLGASRPVSTHTPLKKKNLTGAAILKNWNKTVTPRKWKALQPSKTQTKDKAEKFSTLSTRRKYEKRGRDEPAPNIESLTFVDLKLGNTKRHSSTLPSSALRRFEAIPQTPYELIQQGLEKSSQNQKTNENSVTHNSKEFTEDLNQEMVPLANQTDEPTVYRGPNAANPSHTESVSTLSNEETAQPSRGPRLRTSIPFKSYKQQTSFPVNSSADKNPITNLQQSPLEMTAATSPQTSAPRSQEPPVAVSRTGSMFDFSSSSNQPPVLSDFKTSQNDLVSSWDPHDLIGTLIVGDEHEVLGDVRLRGLSKPARALFLSSKIPSGTMHIWCQQICNIEEYRMNYNRGSIDYFESGHSGIIIPFKQTATAVAEIAETLKLHVACAVVSFTSFSLLIYPVDAGLESWNFLNHGQLNVPDGTALKFLMRKPLPPQHDIDNDAIAQLSNPSIREGESNTSLLVRTLLGIEYDRLIKQPSSEMTARSNNFFMFFIDAEQEYRIMYKFLEEHGAKIYSWDTKGAWDYFVNKVEHGVILIEGSFWEIYLIPFLSRVLHKPINVFNITFYKDTYASHPHINRIFPHGHAFLITDSFILLCPHEAVRFLRWFRLNVLVNKPAGTWQLCTRPHIRDYVLSLVQARTVDHGLVFMQMYESLWYILPEDLMDDDEFETPIDEAPVRCMSEGVSRFDHDVGKKSETNEPMDEDAIAANDATHVEWFAGWALTEVERFRRFTVISGARGDRKESERREWGSQWSHIDIASPEPLFQKLKIPAWESKQKPPMDHQPPEKQANNKSEEHGESTKPKPNDRRGSIQSILND